MQRYEDPGRRRISHSSGLEIVVCPGLFSDYSWGYAAIWGAMTLTKLG